MAKGRGGLTMTEGRRNFRLTWREYDSDGDLLHFDSQAMLTDDEVVEARAVMGADYPGLRFTPSDKEPPEVVGLAALKRHFRIPDRPADWPAWCPVEQHWKWCGHNGGVMGETGYEAPR